ncbi:MAG: L-lactate dehydrogenase [Ruminococcus sp.]|nr:L-lactate dehydrogenase [Ruminococcus sp.]
MGEVTKNVTKITILGAGNVGASIAYAFAIAGTCSEIVLVDIAKDKAKGEAMDIRQGTSFCTPVNIYDGEYEDAAGSDIVVVTLGRARKPGQSRIDLAQSNVDIIKSVMPEIAKIASDAVYVVVSNPVDILTYTILKCTDLSPSQVIGSGTILDTSRLRSLLADRVNLSPQSVHGYVLGEHGDTSMIAWSLAAIGGMQMAEYCKGHEYNNDKLSEEDLLSMEDEVRKAGAEVIKRKGATFYAIALSVNRICEAILGDEKAVLTVSSLINGRYGIEDVCLSLPCVIGGHGIEREINPPMLPEEVEKLRKSAKALRDVIDGINFD